MKLRIIISIVFLTGLFFLMNNTNNAKSEEVKTGAQVFSELRCDMCHSVESAELASKKKGGKIIDLSNTGVHGNAEFFFKFLKKEVEIEGKKHAANVRASDDDLVILTEWLATLKTEETEEE